MSKNVRPVLVFDFETNGLQIDELQILQVACVAIDPKQLTIIPNSEFDSYIRPQDWATLDDTPDKQRALSINKIPREVLEKAPGAEAVMKAFRDHAKKFTKGVARPHAGGKNIRTFDLPILDRFCREAGIAGKDGKNPIMDARVQYDIDDHLEYWFRHCGEFESLSMDTMRDYFGIPKEGSHNAVKDVQDEAWIILKFLRLYRALLPKVQFRNSAAAGMALV